MSVFQNFQEIAFENFETSHCDFLAKCGVSGFIVNVALVVSRNKEKDGKQKTGNENGFRFCFLSQKTERKNVSRFSLSVSFFVFPCSYTEKITKAEN